MNKKVKRVISSKYWKVTNTSTEILLSLEKLLETLDITTQPNIKQLSCLYQNENIETTERFFIEYNKLNSGEKRGRTERNFILYYGNKEGSSRWNNYRNTMKNISSEEGYIKRHGIIEGERKWKEWKELLSKKGKERVKNEGKIKQREKSHFCIEYWIKRGLTVEEAKKEIQRVQSENAYKHHSKVEDKSYYKEINPICIEYWLRKGYNLENAEIKRLKILKKCNTSFLSMIERHGEEFGKKKYEKMLKRRRKTMAILIKDGKINLYNGKASKESLEYFVPLSKILIESYGIEDSDIYLGYKNKKEFYLGAGNAYYFLYDFVIKSKKLIIEYNGSRWHPRQDRMTEDEWNKWNLRDMVAKDKYERDMRRIEIAKEQGFKYLAIWDTDTYKCNMEKMLNFIKENMK